MPPDPNVFHSFGGILGWVAAIISLYFYVRRQGIAIKLEESQKDVTPIGQWRDFATKMAESYDTVRRELTDIQHQLTQITVAHDQCTQEAQTSRRMIEELTTQVNQKQSQINQLTQQNEFQAVQISQLQSTVRTLSPTVSPPSLSGEDPITYYDG